MCASKKIKYALIDTTNPNGGPEDISAFSIGGAWMRWMFTQKLNVEPVPFEDADIVLASVGTTPAIKRLAELVQHKKSRGKTFVCGGGACYYPAYIYDNITPYICVGEGSRYLETLVNTGLDAACDLPEAYRPGVEVVQPYEVFQWDMPTFKYMKDMVIFFGSRGCQSKCLFCQEGWARKYEGNPHPQRLARQAVAAAKHKLRVSIATTNQLSSIIPPPIYQYAASTKVAQYLKYARTQPEVAKRLRRVLWGIEGVSERLRKFIGKPVSDAMLVDAIHAAHRLGSIVKLHIIAGLPGETEDDWLAFRLMFQGLRGRVKKKVLVIHLHSYYPMPATPLSILPLSDVYWDYYDDFHWWVRGRGFDKRCRFIAPQKPEHRLKTAKINMNATEEELRRGWMDDMNDNWAIKYSIADYVIRRRIAQTYAQKVGL